MNKYKQEAFIDFDADILLVQNDAKYVRWFYSQSKQSQHDRENFLP
jgi:hypothetical protein